MIRNQLAESEEERRIDQSNGLGYTHSEFIEEYGAEEGMEQWTQSAPIAVANSVAADTTAVVGQHATPEVFVRADAAVDWDRCSEQGAEQGGFSNETELGMLVEMGFASDVSC